jgi:putative DNA primase/helicase
MGTDETATIPPKPKVLSVQPDAIPGELTQLPQWVVWRLEYRQAKNGEWKWTKVPYIPGGTERKARSNAPRTWSNFQVALAAYRLRRHNGQADWDGIGFVFSADGSLVGIDLDHCIVDGKLEPWAAEILAKFPTYAEISPSGTGIKLWYRGTLPTKGTGTKRGNIEMYQRGRYFTSTGHRWPDAPATITDCSDQGAELYKRITAAKEKKAPPAPTGNGQAHATPADDAILAKAKAARNGNDFTRLWSGDTAGYPSQSEADQALCNLLAFYTGPDEQALDRLFRQSALMRPKWDERHFSDGTTYGAATVRKALEGRTEFYQWNGQPKAKTEPSTKTKVGTVKMLADAICATEHFAQDAGGKLHRHIGGSYRKQAEKYIKSAVKHLLEGLGMTAKWSDHLAREVIEYIRADAPDLWERPPLEILNCKNGLLHVADRQLLPHSHTHLSSVQLPVVFDPSAQCPAIDSFVSQVFPADAVTVAWELAAWLMRPDTSIQKAILATGEGANGKSTFLALLAAFIGKSNVSTISLHRLEQDRFAVARLIGKLANICPDLPSCHLEGTSVFKAITGNDSLPAEYKFRDSFDFTPFARLVFSANHPPRSGDSSHAFFRRWVVIPFDRTFAPGEQIPRDILDARLQAPGELSGLLNHALDALPGLAGRGGFSELGSLQAAWREFHATTDPLAVWLARWTIDAFDLVVPCQLLHTSYNAAAEREGRPALTEKTFGQALRRQRPALDRKQRTYQGRLQWCYIGIGLRAADSPGSPDSPDYPLLVPNSLPLNPREPGEDG